MRRIIVFLFLLINYVFVSCMMNLFMKHSQFQSHYMIGAILASFVLLLGFYDTLFMKETCHKRLTNEAAYRFTKGQNLFNYHENNVSHPLTNLPYNNCKVEMKILLNETNTVNLHVLRATLKQAGYEVIMGTSETEIVTLSECESIDLLILDRVDGGVSLLNIIQQLRAKFTLIELPILVLIDPQERETRLDLLRAGANDYIIKPCYREELCIRIETLVNITTRLVNKVRLAERKTEKYRIQLQNTEEKLDKIIASRTHLLANIGYDLGTPVTVIQNYLQAVKSGIIEQGETDQYFTIVYHKVNVLNRLVSDLFDLSKLESGQFSFVFREVPVYHWLHTIKNKIETQTITAGRKASIHMSAIPKIFTIMIDPLRMDQVISTIVKHVIDHTSKETGTLDLFVTIDTKNMNLILRFVDNGLEIEQETIQSIFDCYYKVKAFPETYQVTGISLAIVKEIIIAHEGTIQAEQNEGNGSTFRITLPIKK